MLNSVVAVLNGVGVPPSTNSYESIATVTVGAGGSTSIDFNSISGSYTHLQLRTFGATAGSEIYVRFNSDTGSNYDSHLLYGTGSSTGAYYPGTLTSMYWAAGYAYGSSNFGASVIDILDYKNTSKYKTLRALQGYDTNGSGQVNYSSSLWMNTAAITSITLFPSSGSISQYSSFALYGVK